VQAFINTRDVDQGTDLLLDRDSGREWLTAAGLVAHGTRIDAADLRAGLLGLLLTVRDAQADGTWSRLKLCANSECQ
jgi:hypothetical protein